VLKNRSRLLVAACAAVAILTAVAVAQFGGERERGRGRGRSNWSRDVRPEGADRGGVPEWKTDERFKEDVFCFVRVRYSSYSGWGRGGGKWATDYPDADLNLSYRLHELTALETDPYGKVLELTDDALFDYPWLYMIEPGRMYLEDAEVLALRKHLLNGGFLMVDDFWGEDEWQNFYENIKRVFPDKEPRELPLEHEIFHCVYDLQKKPQIPHIGHWFGSGGGTSERWDSDTPHYRGIFDDKGRMMVIICHNTDVGDGWEREGADPEFFRLFSEKWSYPLGINILMYAMTH
jgi:hypothetical protein